MGFQDWSKTAASNASVGAIDWAEGMPPGDVNDSARAMMADLAKWRDDTAGALTTTGSSNAYTVTTNAGFASLADGIRLHLVANHSSTGAATLNVDALGTKAIRRFTASGEAAIAANDILANGHYIVEYDASANSAAGAWILLNPTAESLDSDLTAIAGLSSTGLIARTGSGTAAVRTITAPAAGITVSNGDGVSGNPTLALANDLAAYEGLSSTGIVARTGDGSAAARTITAGTGISISNGDGVSGNPTISCTSVFTAAYVSSAQSITSGGTLSLSHGLGNEPILVVAELVCGTAENGYSVGDRVPYFSPGSISSGSGGSASQGYTIVKTSAQLNIKFGATVSTIQLPHKSTGNIANCNNESWSIIFRAFL